MAKTQIHPDEMRARLKSMGYRARTKRNSQFVQVSVFCGERQVNGGNVMTPDFREKYANYFDWAMNVSVADEHGWRYIL